MADLVIGNITVDVVSDGGSDYDLEFLFPGKDAGGELGDRLNPDGTLHLPYDCLLVTTPAHRVLIDTGMGGAMRARLKELGVVPDVVLLTHAHADHIGGLLDDGRLVFPEARHVMTATEWATWTADEVAPGILPFLAEFAHGVLPALEAGRVLDLVDGPVEVVPGIELIPAPGHTPGHGVVAIRSGEQEVLLLADAVLDPMHLAHPDWSSVPDTDPETSVTTRRALLDRVVADGTPVLGYHFAGLRHVERAPGGYRFAD